MRYAILKNNWIQVIPEAQGGLPVVETPPPSPLEYGYKAVAHYEQQENQIVKVWEIQPWTDEERAEIEAQGNDE